ncbi:putative regulatory protein, partial [Yersinia pestis PY-58]
MYKIKKFSQIT